MCVHIFFLHNTFLPETKENYLRTLLLNLKLFLGGENWLHQCQISVCPTGEVIALANGKRLVILSAKWDSTRGLSQFQISYAGVPDEDDVIKAVLCLPIVGQSQNSHVSSTMLFETKLFLNCFLKTLTS